MINIKKSLIIVFLIIVLSSFASAVLNDAVTYYSFDDDDTSGTNSSDISGYGYDGLISGATTGGTGHINEDYSFDGTNDKVTGSDVIDTSSSFSVNFWVNPDDVSGRVPLSVGDYDSKVDGFYLTWWNTHNIYVYYGTGASVTSLNGDDNTFVNGEYHMVTVTYDGTTLKLYGDAVLDISGNVNIGDTAFPVLIGDRSSSSSFFSGDIDEVGVWNKTLTPTEIETLYNATENPYSSTPATGGDNITITRNNYYALNSSNDKITTFNTTNLEEIEKTVLNFTITTNSSETNITSYYFNFTAGGLNSCSLGNIQGKICYNYTNSVYKWIQFINGSNSTNYDGSTGNQGDRIIITETGTNNNMNLVYNIDEHYNPNVFKHYEALYDFSDVKWQTGTDQRITKNNYLKIELNRTNIPLDADQYKLDLRVNYSAIPPSQPLLAYICNSSYVNGDPTINNNCVLVAEKLPSDLKDDGTKFRGIFTKNLVSSINNMKYVVLKTDETSTSHYYSIKTYKSNKAGYTTKWNYSTDSGITWSNLGDGYETELNINWFYDGATPTKFHYLLLINTSNGETKTFESSINWSIDPNNNYPPLITLESPEVGENVSLPYNLTGSAFDTNNDSLNISIYVTNSTGDITSTIVKNLTSNETSYEWNIVQPKGNYSLLVIACETNTTQMFCVNVSHQINVINTPPSTPSFNLTPGAFYYNVKGYFEVNGSTDINGDTITYLYQVFNVNKGLIRQDYSTNNYYTPVLGDVGDTLMIRAIASTIDANSSIVTYNTTTYLTLANFYVYREKTNTPLIIGNVDELSVSVICIDDVDTTIMSANNVTLNITCAYEFIKVNAEYNNVSYFRIITPSFTPSANVTVYMLDLTLDTGVEIILNINDLTGDYSSGTVSIDRYINSSEVNIISQPFDIENSATLFLLKDALYTVSVINNDGATRVLGNLIPSSAGEKTLSLPEISFLPDDGVLGDEVFWNFTYSINGSGFIRTDYYDSENNTNNISFVVYNESDEIVFQKLLIAGVNNTANIIISYTPLQDVNQTYTGILTINHAVIGEIIDTKIFNPSRGIVDEIEQNNVLPGLGDAVFWIALLILIVIGLSFDAQFSHIGMVVVTFFLIAFTTFGFISFGAVTGVVISIIALLTVLNFVTRSRKETGGD